MNRLSLKLEDSRGVSPVIGVILMVAITVILAAVIGTFVFSLADQTQESVPNARITITEINTGASGNVTFAHSGGDIFTEDNTEEIRVTAGGTEIGTLTGGDLPFEAGDEATVSGNIDPDDTVRVVWVGQDRSNVVAIREA